MLASLKGPGDAQDTNVQDALHKAGEAAKEAMQDAKTALKAANTSEQKLDAEEQMEVAGQLMEAYNAQHRKLSHESAATDDTSFAALVEKDEAQVSAAARAKSEQAYHDQIEADEKEKQKAQKKCPGHAVNVSAEGPGNRSSARKTRNRSSSG